MKLKITLIGTTTMLMHSNDGVNPLHPLSVKMKQITAKGSKKQTTEDLQMLSDLEFERSMYWDDKIGVFIPSDNIEACIKNGASKFKQGKDIDRFVEVTTRKVPLDYGEELTKEELVADYRYRDVRPVASGTFGKSRVLRSRARFDSWRLDFTLQILDGGIDGEDVIRAIDYAGQYIGLGDFRPKYGKFTANIEQIE